MSRQEINLLNPALREKRDWLNLSLLAGLCLLLVLAGAGAWAYARYRLSEVESLSRQQAAELATLRQGVGELEKNLAARQADPRLQAELAALRAALQPRQEAFERVKSLTAGDLTASGVLAAFARQTMTGVWLTELQWQGSELQLRGRLLEGDLLPAYIRRLNAEPAFRGRSFATLEMKLYEPPRNEPAKATAVPMSLPPATAAPAGEVPRLPFVEFSLSSNAAQPATGGSK